LARSPLVSPSLAAEIFLFLVQQFFTRPHELRLADAVTLPLFEGRFPKAGELALRMLKQLLSIAQDTESVGPDEAGRYLLAASRLVASPLATGRSGDGKATAVHLLDLLEKRVQLGFREDGEALRLLARSTNTPNPLREKAEALASVHVPKDELEDDNFVY
jgi:hypothetical protein